jgi:carboxymethylenebutenolidase
VYEQCADREDTSMSGQGEMAEIGGMPAYVARPAGTGPFAAVVVIQEAFGLNEHIKDVTRRVAAEGYVALAPDLFHRSGKGRTAGYDELPKALELMGALKDDEIVADVGGAIAYLEKQPSVRAGRIGITGFCMGGRVSYLVACALPKKIAAAVPYYGGGIPIDRTTTLEAPVLAFFGEDDPFIPLDQVERLRSEAKRLGKRVEVVVYPKAPHGFFCNERDSYRPEAAKDAWERTKAFFKRHLQG